MINLSKRPHNLIKLGKQYYRGYASSTGIELVLAIDLEKKTDKKQTIE